MGARSAGAADPAVGAPSTRLRGARATGGASVSTARLPVRLSCQHARAGVEPINRCDEMAGGAVGHAVVLLRSQRPVRTDVYVESLVTVLRQPAVETQRVPVPAEV